MFRENKSHLQGNLFSTLDDLPSGTREMLEQSWAGTFRREVFSRLDEKPFAVLYAVQGSRPNVPVNVLVGLEILKTGFSWSDEEMYHKFHFDLQVRFAWGYEALSEGHFALRTVYYFRDALSRHMQATGENLLEQAFAQITDEQLSAFALKTGKQRMDSTQLASDMRQYSCLQLLVEILQRVNRMLSADDQLQYGLLLGSYLKGKSSQYVYHLKTGDYASHLAGIGQVMAQLVPALAADYGTDETYQMLVRVFHEHFRVEDDEVALMPAKELGGTILQSPDDPEATFRTKNGSADQGYVANVTETCDPENDFQLVVKTQTASNITDDAAMMVDAIPDLAARTDLDTLYTDGGYNGPDVDPLLDAHDIDHVQTAIRGGKPDPTQVTIADFTFAFDADDVPLQATCPQGQAFPLEPGNAEGRYIGRPDADTCNAGPLLASCQVRPQHRNGTPTRYLNDRQIVLAGKRQALDALPDHERNLRPAVEATMRSLKHPFRHGRVLVRGKFRMACAVIASAFMINVRRIHRAQAQKPLPPAPANSAAVHNDPHTTFLARLGPLMAPVQPWIPYMHAASRTQRDFQAQPRWGAA